MTRTQSGPASYTEHASDILSGIPRLTQVHDDLGGARVQGVEIRSVILVKTLGGEVFNASESVHEFRAHFIQLILGGGKTQILVVRHNLQRICTSRHGIRTAFVP